MKRTRSIPVLLAVVACESPPTHEQGGMIIGGLLGGAIGSQVGGGGSRQQVVGTARRQADGSWRAVQ